MRNSAKLMMGVVAMGLPVSAGAEELILSLASNAEYRTNEFRTNKDRQDSVGLVFFPLVRARRTESRLRYTASYRPRLQGVLGDKTLTRIDHNATLNTSYAISRRTQFSLSDSFSIAENTLRAELADDEVDPDPIEEVTDTRFRTIRNLVNVNLGHTFTSRLGSTFSASHTLRNSSGPRTSDITVLAGRGSMSYAFTSRFSGNFGGAYSRTFFADNDPSDDVLNASRSTSIQGFLGASYRLSPTFRISANGGPVMVEPDRPKQRPLERLRFPRAQRFIESPANSGIFIQDPNPDPNEILFRNIDTCSLIPGSNPPEYKDCDGFPDISDLLDNNRHVLTVDDATLGAVAEFQDVADMGARRLVVSPFDISDRTFTFFASVGIDKSFKNWNLSLTYRRTESPNSGIGATSVVDVVTGGALWRPNRQWRVTARAGWNQRRASVEQVVQINSIFRASDVGGSSAGAAPGDPLLPVAEFVRRDVITSKRVLDVMQYSGSLILRRMFTERVSAELSIASVVQRTGSQVRGGSSGNYEDFRFGLRLDYSFAPFRF